MLSSPALLLTCWAQVYWVLGGMSEQDAAVAAGVAAGVAVAAVDPQRPQLWSQKPDINA